MLDISKIKSLLLFLIWTILNWQSFPVSRISFKPLRSEDTHYMALGMNYSTAGFELILSRKMSFYIITYYLPSGLFVGISWVSFLINPEVIPGRMTMLVTLFLVLINIHNTIQTNSPKVDNELVDEAIQTIYANNQESLFAIHRGN